MSPIKKYGIGIALTALLMFAAGFSFQLLRGVRSTSIAFIPALQVTSQAEIDRVIARSVAIDASLTKAEVDRHLTAIALTSGGSKFIIYRFAIANKTCGKAGCLYVATDGDGWYKGLQLFQLPPGNDMFAPASKPGCFTLRQQIKGRIEDYEICKPTH